MSGLSIDHGSVVSVDPDALRDLAMRLDVVCGLFDDAGEALHRAYRVVVDTPGFSAVVDTVSLHAARDATLLARDECREATSATVLMADVFEYVEQRTRAEMLAGVDPAAAGEAAARADRLAASDERVVEIARSLWAEWEVDRRSADAASVPFTSWFGVLQVVTAVSGALLGVGRIPPGAVLTGRADPVTVTPVTTSSPQRAPSGIAGALSRMPKTDGAQVAVERYTYADGRTRYVAYLLGTRSPTYGTTSEPWDMKSNLELYGGERSASYQATVEALEAAGARPGDEVDLVGHSQSGMVAAHLAMESDFDVSVTILAGSPAEPTLQEGQTLVQLVHVDDPVANLADGGAPAGTGSGDSIRVEAQGDPGDGPLHVWSNAHALDAYVETAREVDASLDPRVRALDDFWAELDEAEVIERTEFVAERAG